MASTQSPEAEKWRVKYYGLLDKFDKQETDWVKSEQLLTSALSRVSLVAEGQYPPVDTHLQALRVVLKEKFNIYRVESVLTELLKLVTEFEKKSKGKKSIQVDLNSVTNMLDGIKLPKELNKKKNSLIKELKNNPSTFDTVSSELKSLFKELNDTQSDTGGGIISRLFSNKTKTSSEDALVLLSDAVALIPWSEKLQQDSRKLTASLKNCKDNESFDKLLKDFLALTKRLAHVSGELSTGVSLDAPADNGIELNAEKIKQQSLNQFVENLKETQPEHQKLQSIELSDKFLEDEPVLLAQAISQLISLAEESGIVEESLNVIPGKLPRLKEVFIQLLEHMVVPVALLNKVEELKGFLEHGEDKDWKKSLKKIVQFINEVRFQQYQEEGEYEDFLQEITNRLQEMVQFLVDENNELETSEKKGGELNKAVTKEMDGLRQGVEAADDLDALQSVVNSRLDAISNFMLQHSQLEKKRFNSAKSNLSMMQEKINSLENETAALKVSLAEKSREAMYDALTEIPNRLFYEKRIKEDIARWKRFETPLSLAIWDVDKFKNVNDTYGHKAGDKVLKAIAQILNKRIRETDFLARYGGEEFVMLLPGTIEEETLRLANELRQAVADCAFHYNEKSVNITISCGISGFREGDSLTKVFERADKALYQAKESGRNRCVIAACRST